MGVVTVQGGGVANVLSQSTHTTLNGRRDRYEAARITWLGVGVGLAGLRHVHARPQLLQREVLRHREPQRGGVRRALSGLGLGLGSGSVLGLG